LFIIRALFWLTVVLLLIPGGGSREDGSFTQGAADALLAARGVVADLSGICERQPDVCIHGGAALQSLGARAIENAAMLAARFGDRPAGESGAAASALPEAGTLKAEDVAPRSVAAHAAGKA